MSAAAAEALEKAKAIAAKLSGQPAATLAFPPPTAPDEAGGGSKRKRWGVLPEGAITAASPPALASVTAAEAVAAALAAGSSSSHYGPPDGKKSKTGEDGQEEDRIEKRIFCPVTKEKPAAHFVSYLRRHLPDVVSSVHREMGAAAEEEDGKKKDGSSKVLTIELDGRGASSKPPVPGMPEPRLHAFLSGTKDAIQRAVPSVEQLMIDAGEAEVEVSIMTEDDPVDSAAAAAAAGGSDGGYNALALVSTGAGGALTGSYRPASVAMMIGGGHMVPDVGGPGAVEETIGVPHGVVGFIIGRGGENIASMQSKTGCRIQIENARPGQQDRIITLTANSQEAVNECRAIIESMVQDRIQSLGGGNRSRERSGESPKDSQIDAAIAAGHIHVQMDVPDDDVGLIIGKAGSTIRTLQETTGANIQVPPSTAPENASAQKNMRVIHITHPTQDGIEAVKQQIGNILRSKQQRQQQQSTNGQATIQVPVGICSAR